MAPNKINVKERVTDDKIDLSMSDLGDVPVRDIATFRKATSLDLSDNRLVVLPKNFPTLTHITTLDLSKNELKELPENFGDLVKLRHLDLYRNQLQYLPISFSKLTNLRWLDLKDNPLVPAVGKIAGPCLDAKQCLDCAKNVVNFFIELQKQVEEEKNKLKQQQKKEVENMPQQIKHESKKNKKKAKEQKKSTSDNYSTNNVQIEPKTKAKQHKKKEKNANQHSGFQKKSSSSVFSIFKWLMLIFLILFILTSTGCKCTQPLLVFVQENYRNAVNYLPDNLKIYGVQLGDNFGYVHLKTGQLINDGTEFVVSKDWKQIYDKMYNFVLFKSNKNE